MKISIQPRDVYGRMLYFPMDKIGKLLCKLLRRKSFADWQLLVLVELGYDVEEKVAKTWEKKK